MSGRDGKPLSMSPEAVRKRNARAKQASSSSSNTTPRGGERPAASKGNPMGFDSPLGKMGEPLSAHEAERQLFYGHVGLAKALRSEIDLNEFKEEFEVAGENYAYVANHIWPPLRMVIRFIAPVVLVAVLLVIWGNIIAATPWMGRLRDWWQRRNEREPEEEARTARNVTSAPAPETSTMQEEVQAPPPVPHRGWPARSRIGGRRL